ncbi:MAG: hypothetical protein SGPRY_002878 [Prymnesium sp.]
MPPVVPSRRDDAPRYKTLDKDESRRGREETTISLRKDKRAEQLQKKRFGAVGMPMAGAAPDNIQSVGSQAWLEANPTALVEGVHSDDPTLQLPAVTQFRKLLSIERSPPIEEVIAAGVVPRFVQFLQVQLRLASLFPCLPSTCQARTQIGDNPMLQFESAWALTNIASGTSEHTRVVIANGAVPIFVQLLMSPNDDVREQAVWALGNIAGDSPECRDLVLMQGVLQPLLEQLNPNSKMSMLRNATWTLSNLCRGKPQPAWNLVTPALPILAQLIFSTDDEVLADGCWALSYLSDGPNEKIQAVLDMGICARIVQLMGHPPASVQTPALRTAGNIVTGDDNQTQCVINCGALTRLLALLGSPKKGIRKEACWTISNITAGTREQIQAVIDSNIIPPLVHLLQVAEFDIKKEAAWSISNATSGGSEEQIKYLVSQGCIKPLCDLLTCHDPRLVTVALEGIENVLKAGEVESQQSSSTNPYTTFVDEAEGLAKLEQLQNHQNEDVYKKAVHILEAYFGVEDDEDEQLAPETTSEGFVFQQSMQKQPGIDGYQFG